MALSRKIRCRVIPWTWIVIWRVTLYSMMTRKARLDGKEWQRLSIRQLSTAQLTDQPRGPGKDTKNKESELARTHLPVRKPVHSDLIIACRDLPRIRFCLPLLFFSLSSFLGWSHGISRAPPHAKCTRYSLCLTRTVLTLYFLSFFLSWESKTQPNRWTKRMALLICSHAHVTLSAHALHCNVPIAICCYFWL